MPQVRAAVRRSVIPPGLPGGSERTSAAASTRRQLWWLRSWRYVFLAPAAAGLAFAFIYPLVQVVRYSFYSGDANALVYVGLENYRLVLSDPVLQQSVLNNVKLFVVVPVVTALALFIALIINSGIRGWRQYRIIVFLPYVLPATAIGLVFSYLLSQQGVLNSALRGIHTGAVAFDWLGSPHLAIWSIAGVIIWQQLGFGVVVFTAALLSVPGEIIEAARIDCVSWWQIQWRVLLPQIRRIVEFFMVLEVITVLSAVFTFVYVLTRGGPGYSSSVLEYYIYQTGFDSGSIGAASAAAVFLLAIASVFIIIYMRLQRRRQA